MVISETYTTLEGQEVAVKQVSLALHLWASASRKNRNRKNTVQKSANKRYKLQPSLGKKLIMIVDAVSWF